MQETLFLWINGGPFMVQSCLHMEVIGSYTPYPLPPTSYPHPHPLPPCEHTYIQMAVVNPFPKPPVYIKLLVKFSSLHLFCNGSLLVKRIKKKKKFKKREKKKLVSKIILAVHLSFDTSVDHVWLYTTLTDSVMSSSFLICFPIMHDSGELEITESKNLQIRIYFIITNIYKWNCLDNMLCSVHCLVI